MGQTMFGAALGVVFGLLVGGMLNLVVVRMTLRAESERQSRELEARRRDMWDDRVRAAAEALRLAVWDITVLPRSSIR